MDHYSTKPANPVARGAGFENASEWVCSSPNLVPRRVLEIQAEKIARQFRLPPATARLTASLAFGEGGR